MQAEQQAPQNTQQKSQEVKITEVNIDSENVALNVMVGLLNLAQRRGAYNMEESAKAWECIKMFMRTTPAQQQAPGSLEGVPEENTVLNA